MSVDGTWQLVIDSPRGEQQATVELREDDGRLTGTVTNANNVSSEIFDGEVDGDNLRWKVKMKQIRMTLTFTTTVADETMSGKVKAGMFGSFGVAGSRVG